MIGRKSRATRIARRLKRHHKYLNEQQCFARAFQLETVLLTMEKTERLLNGYIDGHHSLSEIDLHDAVREARRLLPRLAVLVETTGSTMEKIRD